MQKGTYYSFEKNEISVALLEETTNNYIGER